MPAYAQAINEYREGANVDGSCGPLTEICGQKLWTVGGSEGVLTTPLRFGLITVQINFDVAAISQFKE